MKKLIVFSVVVILFMTGSCMTHISKAEAPIKTVKVLRETKEWTPNSIKAMIRFVSREYDYPADKLIWLADAESDFRHNVIGDSGKAVGIFQIWPLTWKGFVEEYDLEYTDRTNPVDQTIATISALKDGKKCLWSPYKCK